MANKVTTFLKDKLLLVWRGVIKENPTFVLVLGMCPTLGTTTSAENGFGVGVEYGYCTYQKPHSR